MLYKFILNYVDIFSFLMFLNILTVRTGLAMFTSMFVVFLVGTPFINFFSSQTNNIILLEKMVQMNILLKKLEHQLWEVY